MTANHRQPRGSTGASPVPVGAPPTGSEADALFCPVGRAGCGRSAGLPARLGASCRPRVLTRRPPLFNRSPANLGQSSPFKINQGEKNLAQTVPGKPAFFAHRLSAICYRLSAIGYLLSLGAPSSMPSTSSTLVHPRFPSTLNLQPLLSLSTCVNP